jgi:hypothetical protein
VGPDGLSAAVANLLEPITTAWQRRSFAIVKEVRTVRARLIEELNETVGKIAVLRFDIEREVRDVKTEIHDLESELYFGVLKSYQLTHKLRKAKKTPKKQTAIKWLITGAIAEVGVMVAVLIVQIAREQLWSNRRGL